MTSKPKEYVRISDRDPRCIRVVDEGWVVSKLESEAREGGNRFGRDYPPCCGMTHSLMVVAYAELKTPSYFAPPFLGYAGIYLEHAPDLKLTLTSARYNLKIPPFAQEEMVVSEGRSLTSESRVYSIRADQQRGDAYLRGYEPRMNLPQQGEKEKNATALRRILPSFLHGIKTKRNAESRKLARSLEALLELLG